MKASPALLVGLSLAPLVLFACIASSPGEDVGETAAEAFCNDLSSAFAECPEATACEASISADCTKLAGLVSEPFLQEADRCVAAGGDLGTCLQRAAAALAPSDSHRAFAAAFCDACLFGVPGCSKVFFEGGDGDAALAGLVTLPLGEDVIQELTAECAQGLGCAATFPTCAEGVLAKHSLPLATTRCLLGMLTDGGDAPSSCAGGEGGSFGGAGGGSDGGGAGGEGGGGGEPGSVETVQCFDDLVDIGALLLETGDAEFLGHGPRVTVTASITTVSDDIVGVDACVTMEETQANYSRGARCVPLTFSVPGLLAIASDPTLLQVTYTDHDILEDDALAEGERADDGTFIDGVRCWADTEGDDVCSGADCSRCTLHFGCLPVFVDR